MSYAITLRLDKISASPMEEMWRLLAEAGIDADRHELGYPPHITLTIYPDQAPVGQLREAVAACASRWHALPTTLAGFGVFPGSGSILWAAPVVTQRLLAYHAELQARLPGLPAHEHYRVGARVPHLTVSGPLSDPAAALAALVPFWRPLTGTLDRIDLVYFRPVQVLDSIPLAR